MPNYVVVLVNKVLDDASEISNEEAPRLENKFYNVSTYCKIKYHPTYTELIGLYRVRINKIQEVKEETDSTATAEKASEAEGTIEEAEEDTGEGSGNEETEVSTTSLRKINLNLFSLEV